MQTECRLRANPTLMHSHFFSQNAVDCCSVVCRSDSSKFNVMVSKQPTGIRVIKTTRNAANPSLPSDEVKLGVLFLVARARLK